MSRLITERITRQLNDVQEGGLWLEESFRGKLDHLPPGEAFIRPIPQLHSVAELVSHILVWRKECMQRFYGHKHELMESADNWRTNEELQKMGWENLKQEFYNSQRELIQLLSGVADTALDREYLHTGHDLLYMMEGLVHHDVYHLGQIGITIKLLQEKQSR